MYNNRIVDTGYIDPKEVVLNKNNWRRHPKHQKDSMDKILSEIGWIQDIIVNKTTGNLIDGHLRVEMALKNNESLVPIKYVDLTEEEEKKALITFDPISSMAETDRQLLDDLISSLQENIEYPEPQENNEETIKEKEQFSDLINDSKIALGINKYNPVESEWKGMPEFNMEDQTGFHHIIIHFDNETDFNDFSKTIDQNLTLKTKSTWYPKKYNANLKELGYESE